MNLFDLLSARGRSALGGNPITEKVFELIEILCVFVALCEEKILFIPRCQRGRLSET
jgi:hypothetical protein